MPRPNSRWAADLGLRSAADPEASPCPRRPCRGCCRNYGGPRRLVVTVQGQRRADGRKYSGYR